MPIKRYQDPNIINYIQNHKNMITTTRFNDKTYQENRKFCETHNIGCIYSTEESIGKNVRICSILFVLEMNNQENRITGIGMIKNMPPIYKKYQIYEEERYNRFSYIGKYRIDRKDMTPEEDEILQIFDTLCFKGKRHLKRLKGIKIFPFDLLYNEYKNNHKDLNHIITEMFRDRMKC